MKKQLNIPLFWKFSIAITGTVVVFGLINLYFTNYAVYDLFESELIRHGKITATGIAERSIVPIAYGDLAALDRLVTDQKKIDPGIAYLFIIDKDKKLIAHTFEQTVPPELLNANKKSINDSVFTVKIQFENNPNTMIRDLAVPIMQGNLGVVRIGLYEENFIKSIHKTTRIFLVMVLIFLIAGILGAFFFSYIITTPLKAISKISRKIELGTLDIEEEDFEATLNKSELVKWKNILNVKDEIDTLISSFGEMVTRLKKTYSELQKTQSSLFQSEKLASLGTLSAGIAHEINNPIAGIQNCVKRLQKAPENIKQNILYLEMIDEALKKVEKVVRGLLDFSKKPDIHFTETSISSIIENVLLLVSYKLEKSRIAIIKDFDNKNTLVNASTNHLEQVILNLVLNSIDAIDEKKIEDPSYTGEIKFKINETQKSVELEIADNGIGLPEEQIKNIFNPFFSLKKIRPGTGLGLAVSYSIIEQHNGEISARLNTRKGLTFLISLSKN